MKDQVIYKSCINIPDSTLTSTSMIGSFHEGGPEIVIVKVGNRYQFYDPALTRPQDIIEVLSPRRLRIGDQYFQKIDHPDMNKYEWGILNEILFAGEYKSAEGKDVLFGFDGHIKGLDTVTYYQPHADYTEEQDIGLDRISMGRSQENMRVYGYKFNKDSLLIYQIDSPQYDSATHESGLEKVGELKWQLRRIPG